MDFGPSVCARHIQQITFCKRKACARVKKKKNEWIYYYNYNNKHTFEIHRMKSRERRQFLKKEREARNKNSSVFAQSEWGKRRRKKHKLDFVRDKYLKLCTICIKATTMTDRNEVEEREREKKKVSYFVIMLAFLHDSQSTLSQTLNRSFLCLLFSPSSISYLCSSPSFSLLLLRSMAK